MTTLSAQLRADLRRRYAEPHRHYHGQSHIDAMLRDAARFLPDPALEIAIWYHDAIYDPAAADNEARSAALLEQELSGHVAATLIAAAARMVRLTARHDIPTDVPAPLRTRYARFLDLDLAVLGAAPALYDAYEAGIAAEYEPVHGRDAFRRGRAAFLLKMLSQPRIFHTAAAHAAHHDPARSNMRRALAKLI